MMMKNRQNNKHQSLCTTALSMLPQARGSRHSHEASTTEKLKAARKEAHPTTGGTASLSISFGQGKKKKKNPKGTQAALQLVAPGSELAGAARVTLQEAHNGWVALGPSDELFQGEFP